MEFKMITSLEQALPTVIEFNFEELKKELSVRLQKYNNLIVTEDAIKDAKSDRANLNKLLTAIENKRKEVKKQYLEPYEKFEKKVKEITALIQEPINAIDSQIKAFEDAEKEKKKSEIEAYYNEQIGELVGLVPLDKLWNPRWLNVTYKMADIQKEITETISKIRNDLKILTVMRSEFEIEIKDKYLENFDMSAALAEKARLEEQKKRLEELFRKQDSLEIVYSPETVPVEGVSGFEVAREGDKFVIRDFAEPESEQTKTIKVIFYDTTEAFRREMRELTIKHNIKYGGLK